MTLLKYVGIYTVVLLLIWGAGYLASKGMADVEVISPEKGVKCAVVSRMFNTSVACWKSHGQ